MSNVEYGPVNPDAVQALMEAVAAGGCADREPGQRECTVRHERGRDVLHCFGPCGPAAVLGSRATAAPVRGGDEVSSQPTEPRGASSTPAAGGQRALQGARASETAIGCPLERVATDDPPSPDGGAHVNDAMAPSRHGVASTGATQPPAAAAPTGRADEFADDPRWPAPLDPSVFEGSPAGRWAAYLDEHQITEADPAAVFIQTLTALGAMLGIGPQLDHGSLIVPAKWFTLVVGDSARGRKGTAWEAAAQLLREVDAGFMGARVLSGFGSGEALIRPVADEAEDADDVAGGEPDRRLLVVQTEFANVLRVAERPNSTLSPNLRELYDLGPVRNITKSTSLVASRHHVALIGHITPSELLDGMRGTALSNGFGSRLLMVGSQRTRLISRPRSVDTAVLRCLAGELRDAVAAAQRVGSVGMTDAGLDRWDELYLATETRVLPPLVATLTHRAATLTLRIALVHALLAGRAAVDADDLDVASEIVRYGIETARYVFDDGMLDQPAQVLLEATRRAGAAGLTGRQRASVFSNNLRAAELNELMSGLVDAGLCKTFSPPRQGGGRPSVVLVAVEHLETDADIETERQRHAS